MKRNNPIYRRLAPAISSWRWILLLGLVALVASGLATSYWSVTWQLVTAMGARPPHWQMVLSLLGWLALAVSPLIVAPVVVRTVRHLDPHQRDLLRLAGHSYRAQLRLAVMAVLVRQRWLLGLVIGLLPAALLGLVNLTIPTLVIRTFSVNDRVFGFSYRFSPGQVVPIPSRFLMPVLVTIASMAVGLLLLNLVMVVGGSWLLLRDRPLIQIQAVLLSVALLAGGGCVLWMLALAGPVVRNVALARLITPGEALVIGLVCVGLPVVLLLGVRWRMGCGLGDG